MCVYHAWALRLSGSPFDSVESRLQDAEGALEKQRWSHPPNAQDEKSQIGEDETRRLLDHITAIRAFQAVYRDEIPRVIELAHRALTYRPEGTFIRSNIAFALGWAYRFSGDLEASYKAFDEASTIGLTSGNFYLAVTTKCRAAYGQVLAGRLHQTMASLQEASQIATREDGMQVPVAGYAYVYMGGYIVSGTTWKLHLATPWMGSTCASVSATSWIRQLVLPPCPALKWLRETGMVHRIPSTRQLS